MTEEDLMRMATARVFITETPADRIALLPPKPAKEMEAAAEWRSPDRPEEMERIPLSGESDKGASLVAAIWLGSQAVGLVLPEKPEKLEEDDEVEPDATDKHP